MTPAPRPDPLKKLRIGAMEAAARPDQTQQALKPWSPYTDRRTTGQEEALGDVVESGADRQFQFPSI